MTTTQLTREINKLQKVYDKLMYVYYHSLKYDNTDESMVRFPIDANYQAYEHAEKVSKLKYNLEQAKKYIDEYNEFLFTPIKQLKK